MLSRCYQKYHRKQLSARQKMTMVSFKLTEFVLTATVIVSLIHFFKNSSLHLISYFTFSMLFSFAIINKQNKYVLDAAMTPDESLKYFFFPSLWYSHHYSSLRSHLYFIQSQWSACNTTLSSMETVWLKQTKFLFSKRNEKYHSRFSFVSFLQLYVSRVRIVPKISVLPHHGQCTLGRKNCLASSNVYQKLNTRIVAQRDWYYLHKYFF